MKRTAATVYCKTEANNYKIGGPWRLTPKINKKFSFRG
jgi:hypothetical protein